MPISTALTVRDGNNAAQTVASLADLAGNQASIVSLDSGRQTYRAAANFTPLVTAALTLIQVKGSATKTIRIKRIVVSGVSTALGTSVLQLQRTSTSGAGGTAVTPTIAKLDSASAAATAVVTHFTTAAQSVGTAAQGPISSALVSFGTVTTPTVALAGMPQVLFPEGGAPIGQAIVLRGVTDFLEVQNLTPANLGAGTVISYVIDFEEDAS